MKIIKENSLLALAVKNINYLEACGAKWYNYNLKYIIFMPLCHANLHLTLYYKETKDKQLNHKCIIKDIRNQILLNF